MSGEGKWILLEDASVSTSSRFVSPVRCVTGPFAMHLSLENMVI